MKVLVINLDRSKDRWENMQKAFPGEKLTRIPGIDGFELSDMELTIGNRPSLGKDHRIRLAEKGIIPRPEAAGLTAGDVGCALGHIEAWKYIVENNIKKCIVLEDDVVPTKEYKGSFETSFKFPKDADVLFLQGADSPIGKWELDEKGRIIKGACNYGYMITKKGAEKAIRAQLPIIWPCDQQWWFKAFKTCYPEYKGKLEDAGDAYSLAKGVITKGPDGDRSTMRLFHE